jgi:hypothetical protein
MTRHSWGDPARTEFRTERVCRRCDMLKVTVHEGQFPWVEFHRDGKQVEADRTPPCDARSDWETGEFK